MASNVKVRQKVVESIPATPDRLARRLSQARKLRLSRSESRIRPATVGRAPSESSVLRRNAGLTGSSSTHGVTQRGGRGGAHGALSRAAGSMRLSGTFDKDFDDVKHKGSVQFQHPRSRSQTSAARGFSPKRNASHGMGPHLAHEHRLVQQKLLNSPTPGHAEHILTEPRTSACVHDVRSSLASQTPERDKVEVALQYKHASAPFSPQSLPEVESPGKKASFRKIALHRSETLEGNLTGTRSKPLICKEMQDLRNSTVPDFVPYKRRATFAHEPGQRRGSTAARMQKALAEAQAAANNAPDPNAPVSKAMVSDWFLWNSLTNAGLNPHTYMAPPYDTREDHLDRTLDEIDRRTYRPDPVIEGAKAYNLARFRASKPGGADFFDANSGKIKTGNDFALMQEAGVAGQRTVPADDVTEVAYIEDKTGFGSSNDWLQEWAQTRMMELGEHADRFAAQLQTELGRGAPGVGAAPTLDTRAPQQQTQQEASPASRIPRRTPSRSGGLRSLGDTQLTAPRHGEQPVSGEERLPSRQMTPVQAKTDVAKTIIGHSPIVINGDLRDKLENQRRQQQEQQLQRQQSKQQQQQAQLVP